MPDHSNQVWSVKSGQHQRSKWTWPPKCCIQLLDLNNRQTSRMWPISAVLLPMCLKQGRAKNSSIKVGVLCSCNKPAWLHWMQMLFILFLVFHGNGQPSHDRALLGTSLLNAAAVNRSKLQLAIWLWNACCFQHNQTVGYLFWCYYTFIITIKCNHYLFHLLLNSLSPKSVPVSLSIHNASYTECGSLTAYLWLIFH